MPQPHSLTVYYNSACPVCNAGVCRMRERVATEALNWVDVHQNPQALQPLGLEMEAVRERLHVVDASGTARIGFDAVIETLAHLPGTGWLAKPLRWRGIHPIGHAFYNAFARQLYRWNRRRGRW
jgi:predicted DCC family thiol-disulfide oxidoreductase YuxK